MNEYIHTHIHTFKKKNNDWEMCVCFQQSITLLLSSCLPLTKKICNHLHSCNSCWRKKKYYVTCNAIQLQAYFLHICHKQQHQMLCTSCSNIRPHPLYTFFLIIIEWSSQCLFILNGRWILVWDNWTGCNLSNWLPTQRCQELI